MPVSEPTDLSQKSKFSDSVHAVLYYGSDGGGMLEAALEQAKTWMCKAGGCGECAVCKSVEAGRAVDFMHYKPWGASNILKIDAVRPPNKNRKVDEDAPVPSLIEFLRTPPMMARHKVAVFSQADRLNNDASNALLKTLEEPPSYGKIILTTSEFSRILPTVRSRCMPVACGVSEQAEAEPLLAAFGGTAGLDHRILENRPVYERLFEVFESSKVAPPGAAIGLAEQTRETGEGIAKALDTNARGANAEILRCLAEWLVRNRPERPQLAQSAVHAHRLVVGNVNPGPVFDLLWARILTNEE